MSSFAADRNLLFGILALQMDFVSRDALIAAMHAWLLDKRRPLGELLVEQGALEPALLALVDSLVAAHVARHANDLQESLAALARSARAETIQSLCADIESLADDDFSHAGRSLAGPATTATYVGASTNATATYVGASTSGGRFQVLRPHAHGGLGQVSVANDTELGREVALKEILPRHIDHRPSRDRFVLEAQITGGLEHPSVVPVYGFGTHADGRPYYAMRFIRGQSMQAAIERFHHRHTDAEGGPSDNGARRPAGPFAGMAFRQLLARFIAVCNAIEYAHSRGVVHRDLKPANVMLGSYGETIVVDWGLAKATGQAPGRSAGSDADSLLGDMLVEPPLVPSPSGEMAATVAPPTQAGQALGTPSYMSPEQAEGRLDLVGPSSDVYSLGATLWHLLAGKAPLSGLGAAQALEQARQGLWHSEQSAAPLAGAPPALWAICRKATALRPEDRYPSAQALAADVEHFLADEPVPAYRDPLPARCRRWLRRHPGPAAGATAAVLVGVLAAAIALTVLGWKNHALDHANTNLLAANDQIEQEFRRAKVAIDDYFTLVSESPELKQEYPGMQELRKKLLQKAQTYYESFLKERGDDPRLRVDAGRTYFLLASITSEIGDKSEALALYQKAHSILDILAREDPQVADFQNKLAAIWSGMGLLQSAIGKLDDAQRSYAEASRIQERLMHENPQVVDYQSRLANTWSKWGVLLNGTGKHSEAQRLYEMAMRIHEKLARENPQVPEHQSNLAFTWNHLGTLQRVTGKSDEALLSFEKARRLRENLAREHPQDTEYQNGLAITWNHLGALQSATGKPGEALRSYEAARRIQEKLVRENPRVTKYQSAFAESWIMLGNLQSATGKPGDALRSYEEAKRILEKLAREVPKVPDYQNALAGTWSNLGELQRKTGKPAKALRSFNEAKRIREKLARENPNVTAFQNGLANTWNALGILQSATGKPGDALRAYDAAKIIHEKLARENPEVTEFAIRLAGTYVNIGKLELDNHRPVDALASLEKAVGTLEPVLMRAPSNSTASQFLRNAFWNRALAKQQLGRFANALTDYDRALELDLTLPPPMHSRAKIETYRAACVKAMEGAKPKSALAPAPAKKAGP